MESELSGVGWNQHLNNEYKPFHLTLYPYVVKFSYSYYSQNFSIQKNYGLTLTGHMHASKASKYSFHFSLNHFHVFLHIVKTFVGNTNEIFVLTVYVGNMWFSATNKNSLKKYLNLRCARFHQIIKRLSKKQGFYPKVLQKDLLIIIYI